MQRLTIYTLVICELTMCLIGSGSSQVTFSKGWGPGKRALYEDRLHGNRPYEDCKFHTQPLVAAYNIFMSELRELIICEGRKIMSYSKPYDGSPMEVNTLMNER
ncbi:uncharacterized protein [Venturia canescens]|uniref:uncharacterized protein n=1 Tax=Venturia canescens TaxID=32260 RepID=UPI001C9BF7FB|nr:uncharacterized protein LOC122416987 [Venturia canescens]